MDPRDYSRYLDLMAERLVMGDVVLYAYCLMPNHVHLLLEQKGHLPLSRTLQRLQAAYTKHFNKKHRKVGHLFQGRYKAILVDKDAYLLELVRYIHLNPWRAKLEEKRGAYPWTSHRDYLSKPKDKKGCVTVAPILGLFGRNRDKAVKSYVKFVREGEGQGHREDLYESGGWQILGGEEFEKQSLSKIGEAKKTEVLKLKKTMPEIWEKLKAWHQCVEEPQGRERSRMMEEAAYLATEGVRKTQKEVGEYFGVDQAAISQGLKRLERKWGEDKKLKDSFWKWARDL